MLSSFLYLPPATPPLSPWFLHLSILINICCDGCSEMSQSASPYTAARNLCILATSYYATMLTCSLDVLHTSEYMLVSTYAEIQ